MTGKRIKIKETSVVEILKKVGMEGIIFQGCDGDPKDWLKAINKVLAYEGILMDGGKFTEIEVFEHNGRTNILFPLDALLSKGEVDPLLAWWRMKTYKTFRGAWLKEYIEYYSQYSDRYGAELYFAGAEF